MGFGYKSVWIAVHGREPQEVADALGLAGRQPLDYAAGTRAAHEAGVFVTQAVQGWILAHGRDVARAIGRTPDHMLAWLSAVSGSLGTVHLFGTHRVSDWHQWAWAEQGSIIRAFVYSEGQFLLSAGEVTEAERAVGVVLQEEEPGMDLWSEEQWDSWYDLRPREGHVMQIAGRWSVDPTSLDDNEMPGTGIYGMTAA